MLNGTYTAQLIVTDNLGRTSSTTVSVVVAGSTVLLDGSGNVTITDAFGNRNDDITLSRSGTNLVITDPSAVFYSNTGSGSGTNTISIPLASITGSITVNLAGGDDTLTVDYSGGALPNISFNGGVGGNDALRIIGYSLTTADGIADVTVTHLTFDSGTVVLDGLGTVAFDEIEPLTLGGTAADLVITLPAGADSITLGDDGGPQDTNGNTANYSAIYDSTGPAYSFEFTEFQNPTNSLTINRGSATDDLTVLDLVASGFTASLSIGSVGNEFANVIFQGPVTLGANNATIRSKMINVNSALAAGSVDLKATTSVAVTANITGGAGGVTIVGGGNSMGNTVGVVVNAATITTTSNGNVSVTGTGGSGSGNALHGVAIDLGGVISAGGTGTVSVNGTAGSTSGNDNYGVVVSGSGSQIVSSGGNVSVTGLGGGGSGPGNHNFGIRVSSFGQITSGTNGNVIVDGTGGSSSGPHGNGIDIDNSGLITSGGDGNVTVIGTAGAGSGNDNYGVSLLLSGKISSGGNGVVSVTGTGGSGNGFNHYGIRMTGASSQIASGGGAV